jgi:hypothetical protein
MHARIGKLVIIGGISVVSARMGKTSSIFSGCQCGIHRKDLK